MVATVSSTIGQFNMDNIELLKQLGYEVHIACNFKDESVWTKERTKEFIKELESKQLKWFQVNFTRKIGDLKNIRKSYKEISYLLKNYQYKFVHCHTPIAGAITRMVAKREKIKVIYTAHGFHFYKGASSKNWLLYYPIEKWLSKYTEILITINKEDYILSKYRFLAKKSKYIPGVGIDVAKFSRNELIRREIRKKMNIKDNEIILFSVGELSKRKNHKAIIKCLNELEPCYKYYICGKGSELENLKNIVKKRHLEGRVKFLGFLSDVTEFYSAADIFIFPSLQEGLPVALMEAMANGLPIICSDIRGNRDLIDNNLGGFVVNNKNKKQYIKYIKIISRNRNIREKMYIYNQEKITNFSRDKINYEMIKIYKEISQEVDTEER